MRGEIDPEPVPKRYPVITGFGQGVPRLEATGAILCEGLQNGADVVNCDAPRASELFGRIHGLLCNQEVGGSSPLGSIRVVDAAS